MIPRLAATAMLACLTLVLAEPAAMAVAPEKEIAPDHSEWSRILSKYRHEDGTGPAAFDYAGLKNHAQDLAALDAYIETLASTDIFAIANRDDQFAAWANLYNAITVRLVTEHYPVKSIREIKSSWFSIGPWKGEIVTVGDRQLSLDDIEHDILRRDWRESRVHYALNCASVGCPDLRAAAWRGNTLDRDLTEAATRYVNSARGVTVLPDGRLQLSKIYSWFQEDFGGDEAGVRAHLSLYASPGLKSEISAAPGVSGYVYDWSLNDGSAGAAK